VRADRTTGRCGRGELKKYAGTTLEANLVKGPRGELLQKYAAEFTDLTGIKVESEIIPEQQQGVPAGYGLARMSRCRSRGRGSRSPSFSR
jgi:hypothetical protein